MEETAVGDESRTQEPTVPQLLGNSEVDPLIAWQPPTCHETRIFPFLHHCAAETYMRRGGDENDRSLFSPVDASDDVNNGVSCVRQALHVNVQCLID